MPKNRLLYFKELGLGDDLMVFWAAAGAVLGKIIAPDIRLFFERHESRSFIFQLAKSSFPEIKVLNSIQEFKNISYVRHTARPFAKKPWRHLQSRFLQSNYFCEPYYHKWLSEYGGDYKPAPLLSLAIALGALKVWTPPYDETYDGWQQLSIALQIKEKEAKQAKYRLSSAWPLIRQRLCGQHENGGDILFFPSGGSSQNLGQPFVEQIKNLAGDVKVVRFYKEREEADLYFETISQAAYLISRAKLVMTSDSLPSHLAQFYARKHLLFCSRSRPGNVIYPQARNTVIIDLGAALKCRPCLYTFRDPCAAGHPLCLAQENLSLEHKRTIASFLNSHYAPCHR